VKKTSTEDPAGKITRGKKTQEKAAVNAHQISASWTEDCPRGAMDRGNPQGRTYQGEAMPSRKFATKVSGIAHEEWPP